MDRGAWRATVHGVTKSWTWLRDSHFPFTFKVEDEESKKCGWGHVLVICWSNKRPQIEQLIATSIYHLTVLQVRNPTALPLVLWSGSQETETKVCSGLEKNALTYSNYWLNPFPCTRRTEGPGPLAAGSQELFSPPKRCPHPSAQVFFHPQSQQCRVQCSPALCFLISPTILSPTLASSATSQGKLFVSKSSWDYNGSTR